MNGDSHPGFASILLAGLMLLFFAVAPVAAQQTVFLRGDVDQTGMLDVSDPINTLRFLFLGFSTPPTSTMTAGWISLT